MAILMLLTIMYAAAVSYYYIFVIFLDVESH